MKKFILWITVIVVSMTATSLVFWSYQRYLLMSYRNSVAHFLDFNPYTYAKKTKASVSYFYKSLPPDVRAFISKKRLNVDDLTSCEADLIPGGFSEFAISFFDGNRSNLLVISTENQYKPKNAYSLSDLVEAQRSSGDEYFEIHCLPSELVFNNTTFQPSEADGHFVDLLRNGRQDLIAIKLNTSPSLQIIGFDPDDKKFHAIGKMTSLQKSDQMALPKKAMPPVFFSSLPKKIQIEINQSKPSSDSLTSCQGDVFPARNANYAVTYIADHHVKAFVFEVNQKGDVLGTHEISALLAPLQRDSDDSLEIQCRHGSFVLLNPDFKLNPSEKDLAIYYRESNHEILRVKSIKSLVYSYFAYSNKDSSYHFIGTSEAL